MYAHDTATLHTQVIMQTIFSCANKLTLNITETECMLIGSRQRLSTPPESPNFATNDFQVNQVTTAKSLGVTIDDRRDWSGHIEKVTEKVASGRLTSNIPSFNTATL